VLKLGFGFGFFFSKFLVLKVWPKNNKSISLAIFIFWNLLAQSFPFVMDQSGGKKKKKEKKKNSLGAPPQLINIPKKIGTITIEMCFGLGTQNIRIKYITCTCIVCTFLVTKP